MKISRRAGREAGYNFFHKFTLNFSIALERQGFLISKDKKPEIPAYIKSLQNAGMVKQSETHPTIL
jgi:hypothetical protein